MVRFTTKDDLNLARWQQARPTANVFDACRKEVVCCFYVLKLGMNNPRKIEHSWTKNLRVFQFWFQTPKTNHENTIIISSTIFMFEILTAKYFVRVPAKQFLANVFQFFHSLDWLSTQYNSSRTVEQYSCTSEQRSFGVCPAKTPRNYSHNATITSGNVFVLTGVCLQVSVCVFH